MLRAAQNKDEITIREIPVARWFGYSALAIFLSIPLFITISRQENYSELFWLTDAEMPEANSRRGTPSRVVLR